MQRQKGITLASFIIILAVGAVALYVITRVLPAYGEYGRVMTTLREVGKIPGIETKDVHTVRTEILNRFKTADVPNVSGKALKVRRARGGFQVEVKYESRVAVLQDLGLIAKFENIVDIPAKKR